MEGDDGGSVEFFAVLRLVEADGTRIRERRLWQGTCGCPMIPRENEIVEVKEGTFQVWFVQWDFIFGHLVVVAKRFEKTP